MTKKKSFKRRREQQKKPKREYILLCHSIKHEKIIWEAEGGCNVNTCINSEREHGGEKNGNRKDMSDDDNDNNNRGNKVNTRKVEQRRHKNLKRRKSLRLSSFKMHFHLQIVLALFCTHTTHCSAKQPRSHYRCRNSLGTGMHAQCISGLFENTLKGWMTKSQVFVETIILDHMILESWERRTTLEISCTYNNNSLTRNHRVSLWQKDDRARTKCHLRPVVVPGRISIFLLWTDGQQQLTISTTTKGDQLQASERRARDKNENSRLFFFCMMNAFPADLSSIKWKREREEGKLWLIFPCLFLFRVELHNGWLLTKEW